MFELKQELLQKVPSNMKDEPHFQALLDHIRQHNIENKEHLVKFLNQEVSLVEDWLNKNKNQKGTGVKKVRDKVIHLDVLKKCQKLTQDFLL